MNAAVRKACLVFALSALIAACGGGGGVDRDALAATITANLEEQAPEGSPWETDCSDAPDAVEVGDVLTCTAVDAVGDTWVIDVEVLDEEGNVTMDATRQ